MIIYDSICFLHIYYYQFSIEVKLAFELNFPLITFNNEIIENTSLLFKLNNL